MQLRIQLAQGDLLVQREHQARTHFVWTTRIVLDPSTVRKRAWLTCIEKKKRARRTGLLAL
jgi:hypothetical protein